MKCQPCLFFVVFFKTQHPEQCLTPSRSSINFLSGWRRESLTLSSCTRIKQSRTDGVLPRPHMAGALQVASCPFTGHSGAQSPSDPSREPRAQESAQSTQLPPPQQHLLPHLPAHPCSLLAIHGVQPARPGPPRHSLALLFSERFSPPVTGEVAGRAAERPVVGAGAWPSCLGHFLCSGPFWGLSRPLQGRLRAAPGRQGMAPVKGHRR